MVLVWSFGASFLDPLDAVAGGVAVCPLKASSKRFLGFLGVTFFFALSSKRLWVVEYGPGDEGSWFEGSTGGSGTLGLGDR
jgi:hypothetical protein